MGCDKWTKKNDGHSKAELPLALDLVRAATLVVAGILKRVSLRTFHRSKSTQDWIKAKKR